MNDKERTEIYSEVMGRLRTTIKGRVNKYTSIVADQEDLYQEICVGFWGALPLLKSEAKPSTVLFAITKFKINDYLRKKYKHEYTMAWSLPPNFLENRAKMEETLDARVEPLNFLIRLTKGDTKRLLTAIKKTRERMEKETL